MTVDDLVVKAKQHLAAKQPAEALILLQQARKSEPNNAQIISQCGVCYAMLGAVRETIAAFEEAHKCDDQDILIVRNIAKAYLTARRFQDAQKVLQHGLSIEPEDAGLFYLLGRAHEADGQIELAAQAYENAVKSGSASSDAYTALAKIWHKQGQQYETLGLLAEAEAKHPQNLDLRHLRGLLASNYVPPWHIPMLAHEKRNSAYAAAIRAKIRPGDIVLDIGAGSGLLSMMAVREGAAHVYACEAEGLMARLAQDIIDRNGMSDKITIIAKHSSELRIGVDMPTKADMLITEIFDNALVGEGMLPSLRHAREHLVKADGAIIPQAATLHAALVAAPQFCRYHQLSDVSGFDLSPINALAHPLGYKDMNFDFDSDPTNIKISDDFIAYHWGFDAAPDTMFTNVISVKTQKTGMADCVLMWFSLQLADNITFSTERPNHYDHWRQVVQMLQKPIACKEGDTVSVQVGYRKYFNINVTPHGT